MKKIKFKEYEIPIELFREVKPGEELNQGDLILTEYELEKARMIGAYEGCELSSRKYLESGGCGCCSDSVLVTHILPWDDFIKWLKREVK